ncbi:YutD family protein [Secundilactobacillus silagei]|uniref:YutD family protein n=1 Tax=Secundilactobacillus silagei TaxID=1293415 RepID=UPI0006D0ED54|nr:YutD family protein [Secundilactobacillus silagei]
MIDDARASRDPGGVIVAVDETHYQINDHPYELVVNYRDGFDRVELSDRFNTYFSRYDYLVGDWGFGQLRLRGFYDDKRNVAGELKIGALQDYLDEACNTGSLIL